MKIAFASTSVSRQAGGLFHSVRRSAQSLVELGEDVAVFGMIDSQTSADIDQWMPIQPTVVSTSGPAALGYSRDLRDELNRGNIDLLHQHGIWQLVSREVAYQRRSRNCKVVISPRGMLDPWALKNSAWKKRFVAALFENDNLKHADCLHALNESEATAMRDYGLDNPIAIIPNGVDLPERRSVKQPNWWPSGRVLLFLGRIHPKKGIDMLLKAWSIFLSGSESDEEDLTLVIAGWDDGGHLTSLRKQSNGLGLGATVCFPGAVLGDDKAFALANSNAFILPSRSEGLPVAVLEAWANGLPVLMTKECNLPEGFAVGAAEEIQQSPEHIALEIRKLLSSESARNKGTIGKQLVKDRFEWIQIAQRQLHVYRWLLSGANRADAPPDIAFR